MPWWGIFLILFSTFIVFSVIHYLSKSKSPFKRALMSMSCGLVSLAAVNISAAFTGIYLPVSLLSIIVSLIGGIPGVTLMLGLNLFF